MALRRVDHHSVWLVDYRDALVFVEEIECDGFGCGTCRTTGGKSDEDNLAFIQSVGRFRFPAINQDLALGDGTPKLNSTVRSEMLRKKRVKPMTGSLASNF